MGKQSVEVTPAMLDAGVDALRAMSDDMEARPDRVLKEIVGAVFLAMHTCQGTSGVSINTSRTELVGKGHPSRYGKPA